MVLYVGEIALSAPYVDWRRGGTPPPFPSTPPPRNQVLPVPESFSSEEENRA
jgi:hypothetical protein